MKVIASLFDHHSLFPIEKRCATHSQLDRAPMPLKEDRSLPITWSWSRSMKRTQHKGGGEGECKI